MNKSKTVQSVHLRLGKRTFFFDINISANDKKYLKITESRFIEEGKDRVYNSFILFPENIDMFRKSFEEIVGKLA